MHLHDATTNSTSTSGEDTPSSRRARRWRRALLLGLLLVLFATACGGETQLSGTAQFDVEPLTLPEPTPQEEATRTADDATPLDDSAPTPIPNPERTDEPTATASDTPETAAEVVTTTDGTAEPSEPLADEGGGAFDETVSADFSRRGQIISVTDPSGTQFDRIEAELAAGDELRYSFDVAQGQSVLIRQLGGCAFTNDNVLLANLDGPSGIGGAVFFNLTNGDCTDSDRYDAQEAGTVTLTVSDSDPEFAGSFSFEVVDVTNEPVINLALGDRVEPNSPVAGAGVFEFPGSIDVYEFDVTEGSAYLVRQLGCELTDTRAGRFDLEGVGSGTAFFHASSCDDVARFEAEETGTVVIYASAGATHEGTGTYSFELVDLRAADSFELQLGDVVSPGVPGDGAGTIEEPGRRDVYSLRVETGQTVVISQQGQCAFAGGNGLAMSIEGAGVDNNMFFTNADEDGDGDCFDVRRFTAEFDDTVTMLVREAGNTVTGTYTFEVGSGAETVQEAEDVLDELDATEIDDARVITLDETVLFDFGSAELKSNANQALAEVADVLGVYRDGTVRVVGHTDAVGSEADNDRLSQRRAQAVVDALIELGVQTDRLTAMGAGEGSPVGQPAETAVFSETWGSPVSWSAPEPLWSMD